MGNAGSLAYQPRRTGALLSPGPTHTPSYRPRSRVAGERQDLSGLRPIGRLRNTLPERDHVHGPFDMVHAFDYRTESVKGCGIYRRKADAGFFRRPVSRQR